MTARVFRFCGLLVLVLGLFAGGCSNRFDDGVPTTISPHFLRVKVDDTIAVSVFLSQPRTNEGTMTFNVANTDVLRPAEESVSVKVNPGEDTVHFTFQGVQAGETTIFVTMDTARVQAKVIITNQ